jgi:ATP/ADP translocase
VLVVTSPGSGAEIIPFLKTWVNLPMAIGFMIGYAKLVNVMATETLFYVMYVSSPTVSFIELAQLCPEHGVTGDACRARRTLIASHV